ncbi:hypothetical protein [Yoonia sp. 2307UL14-13]|uniref:hypothetical protein n=1 Tax=Yoonia sp. 2307UL14-13 TaxID=3126506 RepID=UPI0030A6DAAE
MAEVPYEKPTIHRPNITKSLCLRIIPKGVVVTVNHPNQGEHTEVGPAVPVDINQMGWTLSPQNWWKAATMFKFHLEIIRVRLPDDLKKSVVLDPTQLTSAFGPVCEERSETL